MKESVDIGALAYWLQHRNRHKEGKCYKAQYTQKSACLQVGLALLFRCCVTG